MVILHDFATKMEDVCPDRNAATNKIVYRHQNSANPPPSVTCPMFKLIKTIHILGGHLEKDGKSP